MKSILILSDAFYPEIRSSTKILYDLCNYLIKKNYIISVITFHQKKNYSKRINNQLEIHYLSNKNYRNTNFILRGIKTIFLPLKIINFFFKKKLYNQKYKYIYVYSPPTTIALAGIFIKYFFNFKLITNIQDIFPENAKDLGIIKSRFLFNFFKQISKIIYKNSDFLFVHSRGNSDFLKKNYNLETNKKTYISNNWYSIDNKKMKKKLNNNFFKDSKPIIIFSGIMGPSQFYNHFINLNKNNFFRTNYNFLIISEGSEIKKFKESVKKNNFNNFKFMKFVKDEKLREIISVCTFGFISLSFNNKTPVVPGKLMLYSSCGLPTISIVNKESDLNSLIKKYKAGYIYNNNYKNPYKLLEKNLSILTYSKYKLLRKNSLDMYKEMYDTNKILNSLFDKIDNHFA